jgi:Na+/proline symporter/signal transduction histidine kinase/CheY-like chemotaxis protein
MFQGWAIVALAIGYVGALFAVAWFGDRMSAGTNSTNGGSTNAANPAALPSTGRARPLLYALSLGVFCTSWTFFGSVGLAATTGFDFIPVYIGAILMFALGWRVVRRIVRLSKRQNLTSIADFIAARYGKSQAVSAIVTIVAVVGTLPYIALQLKAVVTSTEVLLGETVFVPIKLPEVGILETSFVVAALLALFAVLFGTRHIDTTEHQSGLMLAVAAESALKLAAFLVVGLYVVYAVFGGFDGFASRTWATPEIKAVFGRAINLGHWITVSFLSLVAVIMLPRQFHVAVVENRNESEIKRAAWMFPLYLVAINVFVIPIAIAGLITLPKGFIEPDMFVLAAPMGKTADVVTAIAYLGGLSAATAMVIVESVALSIMISNGLVVPLLLRRRLQDYAQAEDLAGMLLNIRRIAICAIVFAGYLFYRYLGQVQGLAAIGLVSFAAIAQLAPAFFGGLFWSRGTARGAIAGIVSGFLVCTYTLMLPWFVKAGFLAPELLTNGPFGVLWLRPQGLFQLDMAPLTHGVLTSMTVNVLAFVGVSLTRQPDAAEQAQAQLFVRQNLDPDAAAATVPVPVPAGARQFSSTITIGDLQATATRYLGADRAQRAFADFGSYVGRPLMPHMEADRDTIQFTERLLTSAIGAASARLVMALLLSRADAVSQEALQLLDVASEAMHYNHDLLQSALDQVRHGLGVFDPDMRLICWNRQFRELLELPVGLCHAGAPMAEILRFAAMRGDFGPGPIEHLIADRMYRLTAARETLHERVVTGVGRILEIRTATMPQGGIVATYSDITERVRANNELASANETLEHRVNERTSELMIARTKADEANQDKTRFLAAASHDLLQPLNAARLYASSLIERKLDPKTAEIATNIDASLNSVEEIMSALIDLSRMDAGRLEAEYSAVPLDVMFATLLREYEPLAAKKGLELRVLPTAAWVETDRRLLRRVLQNLVSNAIKYTATGAVLLGATQRGDNVIVHVSDTGPGIDEANHGLIFKEFQRLEEHKAMAAGLGLGLSIVQRIGRVLGAEIGLTSELGRGSTFWIALPECAVPAIRMSEVVSNPSAQGPIAGCVALCIDNEPVVLAGMRTLLEGWGVIVLTAASAAQAVEVVRQSAKPSGGKPGIRPSIVLADYHLDHGIGLDAIAAVRTELRSDIPAIIITADHSPEVQRDLKERNLGLLRKPLKAAALRAILTQYVRRQAAE